MATLRPTAPRTNPLSKLTALASSWRRSVLGRLLNRFLSDALQRRLARGALSALVVNVLAIVVALLAQLVLARTLGVEGYGIYAYVLGWVNFLIVPAMLGMNTAQLRYVAAYRAREEWGLLRGVMAFADRVVVAGGLVCCLIAILVVWLISDRLAPALAQTFYVGLLMMPPLALMKARAATVRALGRVVAALAPDMLARQLVILIGVGALVVLLPGLVGPVTATAVAMAAALFSLGLVSHTQSRIRPSPAREAEPLQRRREWLTTSIPLLFIASANIVNAQAGLLMLGWLSDTTDAGIYAIASRLGGFVHFPLAIVSLVFAPTISHLYAKDEHATLQRTATATACWTTAGALMVGLPLFIVPGFVLSLFGEAFAAGETPLRILVIGGLVHAMTGSVGPIMSMTGLERQATVITAGAATLNVLLNLVLIPPFGIAGAATARMVSLVILNLAAVVVVWRRRQIFSGVFAILRR